MWAQTSKNGKNEQRAKNNHGSFYDVQIVHLALFLGEIELARRTLDDAKRVRIATQIQPDGTQPLELARADSFGYSRFNLQALFALATLGERLGIDLWHFETPEGASIRKAFDFLFGYAENPKKEWPYGTSKKTNSSLTPLLRQAYAVYGDGRYLRALEKSAASEDSRNVLFFSR